MDNEDSNDAENKTTEDNYRDNGENEIKTEIFEPVQVNIKLIAA